MLGWQTGEADWRRLTRAVFALGAALGLWLWARPVWIYRDQVELYTLGMELVRGGSPAAFGKLMTGDYALPGALLQLLVGLPLALWRDFRAPTLLLQATHLAAGALLLATVRRRYGWRPAALFGMVFWLGPWRLFHSGYLWESNFLFLPAAVHLWVSDALRRRPRVGPSLALGALLTATPQVHGSALILLFATAWLAWRRHLRPHWPAAAAGALLGGLTLWPTLVAWLRGGAAPPSDPVALDLLMRANSVEKALLYWLRFGSLDMGRRYRQMVFCELPGSDETRSALLCAAGELTHLLGLLSVLLPVAASWWLLRRRPAGAAPRPWARSYGLAVLGSSLAAAALSPILMQGWHLLLAVPAASLPVALWLDHLWPPARRWLRLAVLLFLLWRLPAALLLGLGHPMYVAPPDETLRRHVIPERLLTLD
ncbi:MAG: hypothetical protein R3325_06945 [Thermoanaerobaculia bacterium]|nr:hypothetical protein [Thermoanaerobaculia bacterium]